MDHDRQSRIEQMPNETPSQDVPLRKQWDCFKDLLRAFGLVLAIVLQLYIASRFQQKEFTHCFTKPMWLDEYHTLYLAKEPSIDQLLQKLKLGGDYNPPGLHLALWLFDQVVNISDEWLLRSFSFAVGMLGLIAIYCLLRLHFSWQVSWVSALGVWSSSDELYSQMLQGRFYSFWVAAVAVLCLLMCLQSRKSWLLICVAAASALVCIIHYFGFFTVAIIATGQFCFNYREPQKRRLAIAALLAGAATVLVCLPFYFGQRASLPVATWISPANFRVIYQFLSIFYFNMPILIAFSTQCVIKKKLSLNSLSWHEFKLYASICSLIFFPLFLILFSWIAQPSLMPRYALPTILFGAPLIAMFVKEFNSRLLIGIAVAFMCMGILKASNAYTSLAPDYRESIPLFEKANSLHPVVVHDRHYAYPLFYYVKLDPKIVWLRFQFQEQKLSPRNAVEEAVCYRMSELFPLPKPVKQEELDQFHDIYLVGLDRDLEQYLDWKKVSENPIPHSTLSVYHLKR